MQSKAEGAQMIARNDVSKGKTKGLAVTRVARP